MTPALDGSARETSPGIANALWVAFAAFLPIGVFILLFGLVVWGDAELIDFHSYYSAARALLHGDSPYPEYVYPPLMAIVSMPLALLPLGLAEAIVILGNAALVCLTLLVLGVRDWRCYGLAFLWPPVIAAIQTGNVTILLGLGAALAWRYRDRPVATSAAIGLSLAAKFVLWPLVVWLAATRRYATAVLAGTASVGFLGLSWAVIGFAGVSDYWGIIRHVRRVVEGDSLTAYVFAVDVGASPGLARAVWLLLGLGLLAGCVTLGRAGNERGAFVLAIAASLALTPIVWLHYFALLLVVVAVARPALGTAWFVPLAMYVTPGTGHPTRLEMIVTLSAAATTIGLSLRAPTSGSSGRSSISPFRVNMR